MADSDTEAETEAEATGDDDDTDMAAAMAEMEASGEDGDTDMAAAMAEMEASGEAPATEPAEAPARRAGRSIPAVHDAEVEVAAILGRASMDMSQILKLGRGAIIELNANQSSQVGIYAGDTLIAWGEITVLEDSLAVTITDMVKSRSR
jgi:flagellar motor switch protein FliN/FliY